LIPEAFEKVNPEQFQSLSATILAGILGFFVLEKLLIWRHCHYGRCEAHGDDGRVTTMRIATATATAVPSQRAR